MDSRNTLPWSGYSTWSTTSIPAPPMPTTGATMFKRARSDTEDCDDAYSDHSSKDQCSSPGDAADSCQLKSRKKRRGIIEKRRRDRINSSLGELRRLVPTAYEKQGSAKLEKAEILQMTVEYLKMLQTRGCNPLAYESSKFAMDYHNIGFQECIGEVSKFLSIEGMEIHDSIRMRLMSHLHNVTAQREFASKQTSWYPATPPPLPPPPPPPPPQPAANSSQPYQSSSYHLPRPLAPTIPLPHHNPSLHSSSTSLELSSASSLNSSSNSHSINNSSFESSSGSGNCDPPAPPSTSPSSTSPIIRPLTSVPSSDGYNYLHHNGHQHSIDLYHHHPQHVHPATNYGQAPSETKPYRPWGAEVAY